MAQTTERMMGVAINEEMRSTVGVQGSSFAPKLNLDEKEHLTVRDRTGAERCSSEGCTAGGKIGFGGHLFCSESCLGPALHAALQGERFQAWHCPATPFGEQPKGKTLLGRILVEQGAITEEQLGQSLRAQREAGTGKLGSWLKQQAGLSEGDLAAALGIQWRCPVFRVGRFDPLQMSGYLPRQLMESFRAVPLRVTGSPSRLALCSEDHIDAYLIGSIARMHGIAIDAGLLNATDYWQATRELLGTRRPRAEEAEANSLDEVVEAITCWMAELPASSVRAVAVHDRFWARVEFRDQRGAPGYRDLLCTLRTAVQ